MEARSPCEYGEPRIRVECIALLTVPMPLVDSTVLQKGF